MNQCRNGNKNYPTPLETAQGIARMKKEFESEIGAITKRAEDAEAYAADFAAEIHTLKKHNELLREVAERIEICWSTVAKISPDEVMDSIKKAREGGAL